MNQALTNRMPTASDFNQEQVLSNFHMKPEFFVNLFWHMHMALE